jgi:N-carbamoylputrescine amidase
MTDSFRRLRIAGIQVESRNLDLEGNLQRAETLVAVAAERGAELVLCPEFMAPGYSYHRSLWSMAEPSGGPTELWLARMSRQHQFYIGASYLEVSGDDFLNTFCLTRPDGTVAGRVRKESLPGFEGWYFRGCSEPKVIETELGRIGIGICHDNCTSRFMRRVSQEQIDLLLMPHSAPNITLGPLALISDHGRKLRGLAEFYASVFGVPTVMVNKAAGEDSWSPIPCVPFAQLRFHYVGHSTICNVDGTVCDQLDEQPGVAFAEVVLDNDRNRRLPPIPTGYWSRPPRRFARTSAAMFRMLEWTGKTAYKLSRNRRRAARDAQARWKGESSLRA